MATNQLLKIRDCGQSIWLDNLTRDLIESGELKRLVEEKGVCGLTSNPTIFEKAIIGNALYDADIEAGVRAGRSLQQIHESLIFEDIRNACDIFRPIYDQSSGLDGYVSIEVPPTLAHETEATIQEVRRYYQQIGRENVMIKIPGTKAGLAAVSHVIEAGINVNITLLFSVQSYLAAAEAYIQGLEARVTADQEINKLASVASFFLSRIDNKVDERIDQQIKTIGTESLNAEARLNAIKGKVAIANAKIAYQEFKRISESDRWKALANKGANVQRLLWASTSTKNPAYSDVMYVDALIGPQTVNTLPPTTLEACADHCSIESRLETGIQEAHHLIDSLKDPDIDINLDEVMDEVLSEGIDKFVQPFYSLMEAIDQKIKQLTPV